MAGGQGRERGLVFNANPFVSVWFLSCACFIFKNTNVENTQKEVSCLKVLTDSTRQSLICPGCLNSHLPYCRIKLLTLEKKKKKKLQRSLCGQDPDNSNFFFL